MNEEIIKYLIARLMKNAQEAHDESVNNREDEFKSGRNPLEAQTDSF